MNHLNSILLEGILVSDPRQIQLSGPPEGVRLVKFDLASNRYYIDRNGEKAKETVFIPVQCWGSLGDRCLEKLSKGMECRTVGRLRLCKWISSDGSTRRSIEIVANHLEFRAKKAKAGDKPKTEILDDENNESDTACEVEVYYTF